MTDPVLDPDVESGSVPAGGVEVDYEPTGDAEAIEDEDEEPAGS